MIVSVNKETVQCLIQLSNYLKSIKKQQIFSLKSYAQETINHE